MGNSISSSNVVPRSLIECFNSDGEFDIGLWFLYRSNQRRLSSDPLQDAILFAQNEELEQQSTKSHSYPRVHDPMLVMLPSGEKKKQFLFFLLGICCIYSNQNCPLIAFIDYFARDFACHILVSKKYYLKSKMMIYLFDGININMKVVGGNLPPLFLFFY